MSLVVRAAMAASVVITSGTGTGEEATAPAPAIPMEQVLAQLKAEGYSEVYEIEREHGKYEVKAKNRDGRTVELYLDAATGKTLETEKEDGD